MKINKKNHLISVAVLLGVVLALSSCKQLGGGKDDDDDSDMMVLAALFAINASQNCANFPEKIVHTGDAGGANITKFSCSVSGLVYTCKNDGTNDSVVYTYPSVAAAKLQVMDTPANSFGWLSGFRGNKIELPDSSITIDYTLDSSLRITKATKGANTYIFSNHDSNGFPQAVSGSATGTYANTYADGGSKPTRIVATGFTVDYNYSDGIYVSGTSGSIAQTMTTSGTVSMCP